jgi:hypothetical protein
VLLPLAIVPPHGSVHGQATGAHDAFVYEPDRVPLLQTRFSETVEHEPPQATEVAENAGMLAPLAMVPPQGSTQEEQGATVQAALPYDPESTPAVQVRASDTQVVPQATEDAWYAVTLVPLATLPPHGSAHAQDPTEQAAFA